MPISTVSLTPVVFAIVGLAFVLLLLEAFTIGYAFIRQIRSRRREVIDQSLREQILEIVLTTAPPYHEFVSGLSRREHASAIRVTGGLIERTTGDAADNLRSLAEALEMHLTAIGKVNAGDRIDRLHGLSTLSLLRHPPDVTDVRARCIGDAVLRGAGANALASAKTTHGYQTALEILYHESSSKLSVLGMETIEAIGRDRPQLLLDTLSDALVDASDTEHVQTLLVIAELELTAESWTSLPTWITSALGTDDPRVRAAAVASLRSFDPAVSDQATTAVSNAIVDPASQVRLATAQTIERWEYNEQLLSELSGQLAVESDVRVRQQLVSTLTHHGYQPQQPLPAAAMDAWQWGTAVTALQPREVV